MSNRKIISNRFDPKLWKAIGAVAKARKMSRSKLLELCFLEYHEQVEKMNDAERDKLEAEALRVLEEIARGSKG